MQRNPRAHVLLVGSDEVAYGAKRGDGLSWREWALKQWPMDPSRLHQLPALGYEDYKRVIQRSWVHVYWTVPFILSWSLMEAMASGCCIVASATPPVEEMITSGNQGQLVNFFDPDASGPAGRSSTAKQRTAPKAWNGVRSPDTFWRGSMTSKTP